MTTIDAPGAPSRLVLAADNQWDHPRTTVGVSILCNWAVTAGVPVESVLDGSGITAADLTDSRHLIEARQEMAAVRALLSTVGDRPGLGIEVGRLHHLTAYGYFGFLLAACGSVREMAPYGARFGPLTFAFSAMEFEQTGRGVVQSFAAGDVPRDIRRFVLERDLAASVQLLRELFPPPLTVPLLEIRLGVDDHDGRSVPPIYAECFGVRVSGGHRRTEVLYGSTFLDDPLPMANPHTAALMLQQCELVRAERVHQTGLASRIRARLMELDSLDVTLDDVALALHHPPRTLRRHLALEGTSFRAILEDVRWTIADDMRRTHAASRRDIARRLGYREWSSYLRAERRWQGRTATWTAY